MKDSWPYLLVSFVVGGLGFALCLLPGSVDAKFRYQDARIAHIERQCIQTEARVRELERLFGRVYPNGVVQPGNVGQSK